MLLFVIGALTARFGRANAPRKLQEAKAAFELGEMHRALTLLDGAFIVPMDSDFDGRDAQISYEAICLLEHVLRAMSIEVGDLLKPLRSQLRAARGKGGAVDPELSEPVKKFLLRYRQDPSLLDEYLAAMRRDLSASSHAVDELPLLLDDLAPNHSRTIDVIENLLRQGRHQAALEALELHLPAAEDIDFRAALLALRGAALSIRGDYAAALRDFEECCKLQPSCCMHYLRAAESLEQLGRLEEARERADGAIRAGGDRSALQNARRLLRRLEQQRAQENLSEQSMAPATG